MSSNWKKAFTSLKRRKNKQQDTDYHEESKKWDETEHKTSSLSDRLLIEGKVSHPSVSNNQTQTSITSDSISEENVVIARDMDDDHVFETGTDVMVRHRKKYNTELVNELQKLKEEHKTLNEQLKLDFDAVKSKNLVLMNENETLKDKLFLFYICMIIITILESLLVACFALR